uniref:Uncharacterized protein n=1 Tax=Anguilla anguilla TaxID=7936 RepID=A0A0E9QW11_ANGAN
MVSSNISTVYKRTTFSWKGHSLKQLKDTVQIQSLCGLSDLP